MRIITFLPPIGSPIKSRIRKPFLTNWRWPHFGHTFSRSFDSICKIIVLPLYSSRVHLWVYSPQAWYRKLLFMIVHLLVVIQIYNLFSGFLLFNSYYHSKCRMNQKYSWYLLLYFWVWNFTFNNSLMEGLLKILYSVFSTTLLTAQERIQLNIVTIESTWITAIVISEVAPIWFKKSFTTGNVAVNEIRIAASPIPDHAFLGEYMDLISSWEFASRFVSAICKLNGRKVMMEILERMKKKTI